MFGGKKFKGDIKTSLQASLVLSTVASCTTVIIVTCFSSMWTGAGGFLQNLLFGYGGLRIDYASNQLTLNPQLPPNTTSISFNRV
jgi:hypothetical protein